MVRFVSSLPSRLIPTGVGWGWQGARTPGRAPRPSDWAAVFPLCESQFRHELVEGASHRGETRFYLTRTRAGAAPRIGAAGGERLQRVPVTESVPASAHPAHMPRPRSSRALTAVLTLTLVPKHSIQADATAQQRGSALPGSPRLVFVQGLVFQRPARSSARQRATGGRSAAPAKSTGLVSMLLSLGGAASGGASSRPSRDPADIVVVAEGFPMEYVDTQAIGTAEAAAAISSAWERVPGTGSLPASGPGADAASLRRALRAAAGAGLLVWRGAPEADVAAAMPGFAQRRHAAHVGHRRSTAPTARAPDGAGALERRGAKQGHGSGTGQPLAGSEQAPLADSSPSEASLAEVDAASANVELQSGGSGKGGPPPV